MSDTMGITAALCKEGGGTYAELARGERRKLELLRQAPNHWVLVDGDAARRTFLSSNNARLAEDFLRRQPEGTAVEKVGIVITNRQGGGTVDITAAPHRPGDSWATIVARQIHAGEHLFRLVLVTRRAVVFLRRSGGYLDGELDSALYA